VPEGSLLKLIKGTYGLREAPRLWYLKAREVIHQAGFQEMQTAKACFVLRNKDGSNGALLCLHVDDACYAGEGPEFEKAMNYIRGKFTLGKEEKDDFDFLGRHVVQRKDFTVELDQWAYIKALERVHVSKERRSNPKSPLTPKELHDYRSLVGQLAWPARDTMPQLAYNVSDLQQKVSEATIGDLIHANNVLNGAKRNAQMKQKLIFGDLGEDFGMHVHHAYNPSDSKKSKPKGKGKGRVQTKLYDLGLAAVHDASFMGQPREGSQQAYALMLCSTKLFEGKSKTHLIDWSSGKIHRKMRSTLAAEAASAARAFDRGTYARVMLHEIEHGWNQKWDRMANTGEVRYDWTKMCKDIPFCLGTDCKSLYDVCTKGGSMPEERRVALDLLDVRESIDEMGDQIRWIPTDHMLVDCMTKNMPPDVMLEYLKNYQYAFKYDDVIKHTKREIAKTRKAAREAKSALKNNVDTSLEDAFSKLNIDDAYYQDINWIDHYDVYFSAFAKMYPQEETRIIHYYDGDYQKLKVDHGYRNAYQLVVDKLCVDFA